MAAQATALAAEATTAGLTALATALTELSSEISTNITGATDVEWIGAAASTGLLSIYSQELQSAANTIRTKIDNTSASHLNTVKSNTTTMATNSTTVAANTTTMANMQTDMESHLQKLRELGEGPGIHFVGPYDWFGLISMYKLLIEQGKILENDTTLTPDQINSAKAVANDFINKIKQLPTLF